MPRPAIPTRACFGGNPDRLHRSANHEALEAHTATTVSFLTLMIEAVAARATCASALRCEVVPSTMAPSARESWTGGWTFGVSVPVSPLLPIR